MVMGARPSDPVGSAITGWRSATASAPAQAFARAVVARAQPASSARAKALLFAASRLACFGESVGLELSAEMLLDRSVIERFVVSGAGAISPATRRTLRTNLRVLARALEAYPEPAPVALPRERAKAPYAPAEIEGYVRLAAAQSSERRRMRASALSAWARARESSRASFATSAAPTCAGARAG
jgi:hypothetical protein